MTPNIGKLFDAAMVGALDAANKWARKNGIKLDRARLTQALADILPGAVQDAGRDYLAAAEAGMTAVARDTFNLSIALAGVKAAKRAAGIAASDPASCPLPVEVQHVTKGK